MILSGDTGKKTVSDVYDTRDLAQRMDSLIEAISAVTSGLNIDETLQNIVDSARLLIHCRYCALGIMGNDDQLENFLVSGLSEEQIKKIGDLPVGKGLLGLLIQSPYPIRVDDLGSHPMSYGFPPNHPKMTTFLGVPIVIRGKVFGNLYLTDKIDQSSGEPASPRSKIIPFTYTDERLVIALAAIAGIAIENTRLHQRAAQLVLTADRERIARDLHDIVIQRLFAIGMSLQSTVNILEDDIGKERIDRIIDDLDSTIADIRKTIFSLGNKETTFKSMIMETVDNAAQFLGFKPQLTLNGHVDILVNQQLGEHLLAVLKEGLSNILRHAKATQVKVHLQVDRYITLTIEDNGRGMGANVKRGFGLSNMEERAKLLSGSFDLSPSQLGGVIIKWSVPNDLYL